MADKNTVEEFDDDGKPIVKENPDEGGGSQPPKIKSDENPDKEPEGDEPDGDEDKEPEVPVRKSALQHILARKNETIKKLRSKQEGEEGDDTPEADEDEAPDGKELTPEAKGVVAREIKRAVEPIIQSLASQADEAELRELFDAEPEAAKMSKQIRAYMKHPSYKGVPPAVIYHHLAFDKSLGGAVKKKDNANREALHQKGGGSSRRPKENVTGDIPDVNELDEKEFEELQHKARTGEFLK